MTRIISKIGGYFEKNTTLFTKVCVIICMVCVAMLFFMDNISMFVDIFLLTFIYLFKIVFGIAGSVLVVIAVCGLSKLFAKPSCEEESVITNSVLDNMVPVILTENQAEELKAYSASISRYLNTRYAYYNWKYNKINQNAYADLVKYGRTEITITGIQNNQEVKAQATVHMRDALTVLDVIINSGVICGLETLPDPKPVSTNPKPVKPVSQKKTKKAKAEPKKTTPKPQPKVEPKKTTPKPQPKVEPKKTTSKPQPIQPKSEPKNPTNNVLQNNNVIIVNGVPQIRPNYEMAAKDWISANMRYINEACEASLLANDYEGEKVVALLKKDKLPKETETWQFIGKLLKDDYNEIDRFSVSEAGITIEID